MAPVTKPPKNNRDIKDFFKPRPVSQTSPANAIDRQSSERTWPSPIPPRRGRDQSASGSTRQDPSPTATPSITAAMNDHDIQSLNKVPNSTAIRQRRSERIPSHDCQSVEVVSLPSSPEEVFMSSPIPVSPMGRTTTPAPVGLRYVRDGKEMIQDSDSEGLDDSDSELEDVSAFITVNKRNLKNSIDPWSQSTPALVRRGTPPRTNFRDALRALIDDKKESVAVDAQIKEAKIMLGKKEDSQSNEDEATMNENIFVTSLGEDDGGEEKAHKVLQAVQRTDALHLDTVWHFFLDEKPKQAPSFPSNHLSQVWTSPSMTSLSSRRDLFLSGFVSTWAGMQELPNEVLLWILYDLCSNADTDLQEAYVRVLRESEIQLRDLLTIDRIKDLFASLKSKSEALDIRMVMQPSKEVPRSVQVPLPPGLLPLLTLFKQAASLLTQETRSYTLFILVRMLYDSSVLSSAATFTLLRSTLGSLIDSSSLSSTLDTDISALTSSLPCALKSVTLQATLITALPALSPAQQTFKRALALSFFLNTPIPGVAHLLSASVAKDVMTCLSTNSLYTAIDDTTDYSTLTASMTLLDVAIDVGFGLPLSASAPGLPGDSTPSLTKDPNVTRFNNDVDALAQRLRTIESCIRDSGATDMARMLAKDAVSGVKFRLEGAVRLGAKRKRGMFAAGDEGQESIKKMFMRPPVPKIEKAE